jgi:hypothetical protein
VEDNCVQLCASATQAQLRVLYEGLRDRTVHPSVDDPSVESDLRLHAQRALTAMCIALNIPRTDPRLLKVHVEMLYRALEARTEIAAEEMRHRRDAAECLLALEDAFPTLLAADAGALLRLTRREASEALPSYITLSSAVLSNALTAIRAPAAKEADAASLANEAASKENARDDSSSSPSDVLSASVAGKAASEAGSGASTSAMGNNAAANGQASLLAVYRFGPSPLSGFLLSRFKSNI